MIIILLVEEWNSVELILLSRDEVEEIEEVEEFKLELMSGDLSEVLSGSTLMESSLASATTSTS